LHHPQSRPYRPLEHLSNVLFVGMHLAVLLVFVVPSSWPLRAFALCSYCVRMWAVTAGYHRYFAHRSYKTGRVFQFFLAVLGATAMQNGPIWWASVHRRHHQYADGPRDPHSPTPRGFWYAHIGWNFDRRRAAPDDRSNVSDLTRYPELRFVDRCDWIALVAALVWGFVVSTMAVFHCTMLINSLGHVWGSRRYATSDRSRNNALLAVLTLGEGWHNNHHRYRSSARQGFAWWEIDVTYYVLRALGGLGVVWGIREPSAAEMNPAPLAHARAERLAVASPP
jgi:stearoyl-CoA desaturase (delta-9 desaturase)